MLPSLRLCLRGRAGIARNGISMNSNKNALERPQSQSRKQHSGDRGVTLIEATTVLLIMGTLLGIVVPSFIGANSQSRDRVAQVNLLRAYSAAQIVLADDASYVRANKSGLETLEPDLSYVEGSGHLVQSRSSSPKMIGVYVGGSCSLPVLLTQDLTKTGNTYVQEAPCKQAYTWTAATSTCSKPRRIAQKYCVGTGTWNASLYGTVWAAAALADSGTCWLIRSQVSSSTNLGMSPGLGFGSTPDPSKCHADHAADPDNTPDAKW